MATCKQCLVEFKPKNVCKKNDFCSLPCYWNSMKRDWKKECVCKTCGITFIPKGNVSKGKYCSKKCQPAWNKGLKGYLENEKNGMWKGKNAGLTAKHDWIKHRGGKAGRCDFDVSHKNKRFEWANISGSYLRDINDYAQLCSTCHRQYDIIRRGYINAGKGVKKYSEMSI